VGGSPRQPAEVGRTFDAMARGRPINGWSVELARPVPVRDGTELRTLRDACTMVLDGVPEAKQLRPEWQHAAKLLMAAAESGKSDDVEAATKQIELALLLNGLLLLR